MADKPLHSGSTPPHGHAASVAAHGGGGESGTVEMPEPTSAPLVLAVGATLAAAGMATSLAFSLVGGLLVIVGLAMWIGQLLPGRGHVAESLVEPSRRSRPIQPSLGVVDQLQQGMPGYRLRLPVKVHPISAGIKGGIVGGLIMPIPAMIYGLVSGHGIWLPINLLVGMAWPGVERMSLVELEQFNPVLFVAGAAIHITISLIYGLIYGVILPTLPSIPRPLAWGALLAPLLWTAFSYMAASVVNPVVQERIEWPWFVVSQFIFGIVLALVVIQSSTRRLIPAGLLGGALGSVLMAVPALAWGYLSGHGIWYPINLLAVLIFPQSGPLPVEELEAYHGTWLAVATGVHVFLSLSFGLAYGVLLLGLPRIPAPLAWGALLMPLFWTATSYGLMGVVNPVLQERVDWPWFIVSQFVFGLAAAIVVVRSEQVHIAPAGKGRGKVASGEPS
jgi:hypothetical protein